MGGCFLACFGSTNKRKRLKCCTNSISSKQVHGKYVPLDSEYSKISSSNKKVKKKEKSSLKVEKKVSFNLEVIKTYEPPLNYDDNDIDNNLYFSEGEEETKWELNEEETLRATLVCWHQQKVNVTSYRYQNIQEYYDEDDEIMVEDSDLDDDIFYNDEDVKQRIHLLRGITGQGLRGTGSVTVSHFEDVNVDSVLNPVENVSQWRSKTARERGKLKRQKGSMITEQENQEPEEKTNSCDSKLLQHEMGVNVSLANWLHASDRCL